MIIESHGRARDQAGYGRRPPDARAQRPQWLVLLVLLAAVVSAGCRSAAIEPPAADGAGSVAEPAERTADREPPRAAAVIPAGGPRTAPDQVTEEWMACYVNGQHIGYMHLVTEAATVDGQPCRRYRYRDELKIKRFQDTTVVRTKLESLERRDGQLLRFHSEVLAGPGAMITQGFVEGDQLRLTVHTEGRSEQQAIPWQPDWRGFFADQQSLRDDPLKPGGTRRLKVLLPVVHQVGEMRLKAVAYEATPLLEGTMNLLRIDVTADLGSTELRSIVWTDELGRARKSRDLQMNLVAYSVSREQALQPTTGDGFDLGASTIVALEQPIPRPRSTRRVVYEAAIPDGRVAKLFVQDAAQSVRLVDEQSAEVTVRAIRPGDPQQPPAAGVPPTDADRSPGSLLQSDDPLIVKMAAEAAGDQTDGWQTACRLERFVKATVQLKNYSTAMATAAEVARSREGDCTEHAMLLAALCRARGIPARIAVGLVYYPPAQGFAYHMWTEVWITDRWVGLDATLGEGGIGADHIKLAVSSLQGPHAYADLLPIVHAIGRLQLKVRSVEH